MLLLASCLVLNPSIGGEDDSQSQPLITVGTHQLKVGGGIKVRYTHILASAEFLALIVHGNIQLAQPASEKI